MPGTATPEVTGAETANVLATSALTSINYPGQHNSLEFPNLCHLKCAHNEKGQKETHAPNYCHLSLETSKVETWVSLEIIGTMLKNQKRFFSGPVQKRPPPFSFLSFFVFLKKLLIIFSAHI